MARRPATIGDGAQEEWIRAIYLGRRASLVRRYRRAVTVLVFAVSVATCVALAASAGSHAVSRSLAHLVWWYIPVMLAMHVLAYAGYIVAHHEVVNLSRARPVGWRRGAQIALIGFGGWLISGGFAVDRHALEAAGVSPTEASRSAMALGLLELAVLSPAAWLCAVVLLDARDIPQSVTLPWVVLVPVGFILSGAAALRGPGERQTVPGRVIRLLDDFAGCARFSFGLVLRPREGIEVIAGIGAYWAADILSLWAALRFVAISISLPRLILGYATGYVLTRRSLPFAGVIIIEALLILTLWEMDVPLAGAAAAVLVYRMSDFGLTLGSALFASSSVERALTFIVAEAAEVADAVSSLERQA
jgi:hypothetical protein